MRSVGLGCAAMVLFSVACGGTESNAKSESSGETSSSGSGGAGANTSGNEATSTDASSASSSTSNAANTGSPSSGSGGGSTSDGGTGSTTASGSGGASGGAGGASTDASDSTEGSGGSGAGGTTTGAGGGSGGGTNCNCMLGAYVPVCGVDGNIYDATCGDECVPVEIACRGECPCSEDCEVGCIPLVDSGWCEAPEVEWYCDANPDPSLMENCGDMLPTGAVRFCCPAEFLSSCQ